MENIEVFLLDDHKIVRDGLKSILSLSPQFKVVGEDSHPRSFLQQLSKLHFDILILDLSLPEMSGMEVLKEVKKSREDINVVILSMHDNPEYMIRALREGASAYLSKDTQSEVLIDALKEVKKKGVYYPTQISLGTQTTIHEPEGGGDKNVLTPKEKDVLKLMVKGLSSKQIAAEFGLSSRTIEAHRLNIMKKLGTNNSAETIAIALKLNLIS